LESLEAANNRAAVENVQLKTQLEKTRLENRLLHENTMRGHSSPEVPEVGVMSYKPILVSNTSSSIGGQPPAQFTSPIFGKHPNQGPLHRISTSPITGERLLGAGAAWDLIVCHPLYEQGLVDINDISDRLKSLARCDGQGPVFEESVILDAIHASSGSGRDELL
jgi:AP-1-like factor